MACKTTVGFCILTLYPTNVLNLKISSSNFFCRFWDFLHRQTCCLQILILFSSFWICMFFVSFSRFIALARTSMMTLNRSDEHAYFCLIPDFGEKKIQSFAIKYNVSSRILEKILFSVCWKIVTWMSNTFLYLFQCWFFFFCLLNYPDFWMLNQSSS